MSRGPPPLPGGHPFQDSDEEEDFIPPPPASALDEAIVPPPPPPEEAGGPLYDEQVPGPSMSPPAPGSWSASDEWEPEWVPRSREQSSFTGGGIDFLTGGAAPPPPPAIFGAAPIFGASGGATPIFGTVAASQQSIPPPPAAVLGSVPPPPLAAAPAASPVPAMSPPPIGARPRPSLLNSFARVPSTPARSATQSAVPPPPAQPAAAIPPPPSHSLSVAPLPPSAPSSPVSGATSSPSSTSRALATPLSLAASSTIAMNEDDLGPLPSPAISSTRGHSRTPTHSASLITSAQDLGSAKSFASSLNHCFVGVSGQVEIGLYAAKRTASFLKKLALAQEEYGRAISKILAHEQTKLSKLAGDRMAASLKSWTSLQDLYGRVAKSHLAEASELQLQVVAPLHEFWTVQEERRKEIMQEERKSSLEMVKAREDVSKGLHGCARLLDEARKLQAEAKDEARRSAASGEKTSFFKTLSMKVGRKPETVIKEAGKAAAAYQTSIVTANKRQAKYIDSDLPTLFNDMQSMEHKRLVTIKARLLKFAATTAVHATERASIMEDVRRAVEMSNAKEDINEYIEEVLYEHGPSVAPRPFAYELTCSPADIEGGRLEGNPNSIFRSSLEHCMELQRGSSDVATSRMDIPRIVPTLIARIRELGGFTELGIFRISVGKEDLDGLRKQIDTDQNYALGNVTNAHICAALLKEWLRLLTEPLVPTDAFYQAAIDSVKGYSGAQFSTEGVQKVFDALPAVNQKILREIAFMARDISEPANAEKSKMNVENLAIVFAPSFLRNPSEDPMKLLENTKYETKFTACMFKVVADIKW